MQFQEKLKKDYVFANPTKGEKNMKKILGKETEVIKNKFYKTNMKYKRNQRIFVVFFVRSWNVTKHSISCENKWHTIQVWFDEKKIC